MNFYICEHCNKIVIHMKNSGLPTACCGEKMKLLVPTREGASEKHYKASSYEEGNPAIRSYIGKFISSSDDANNFYQATPCQKIMQISTLNIFSKEYVKNLLQSNNCPAY